MKQQLKKEIIDIRDNVSQINEDFAIPIPIYNMGKDMDFSVLISLLIRSKFNREESYMYINYSYMDKDEICNECKISQITLSRKLKYLEEKNILTTKNTEHGFVYVINYSIDSKDYVKINREILISLIKNTNKFAIKLYILLKIHCDTLENVPISNTDLCKELGYSVSSNRSISKISSTINLLVEMGFIDKLSTRIYGINEHGKKIIRKVDTYYRLNGIDYFNE